MSSRWLTTLALVIGVLLVAAGIGWVGVERDRDRAFEIERFHRQVRIEADGTTRVVETIDVVLHEPRRGIIRTLPPRDPIGRPTTITAVSADAGTDDTPWPLLVETAPDGSPELRIGDPAAPLAPGRYRYRLGYTTTGWSHRRAADPSTVETRLDVPGHDWPTTIGPTVIEVHLPGPVTWAGCVTGRVGSTRPCAGAPELTDGTLRWELGPHAPWRSATVALHTPASAFSVPLPTHAETALDTAAFPAPVNTSAPVAAVLLVLVLLAVPVTWTALRAWYVRRDRVTDPARHRLQHPTALPGPPWGLHPPEVAGLLGQGAAAPLLLPALIDLEQRGLLVTEVAYAQDGTTPTGLTVHPRPDRPAPAVEVPVLQALFPRLEPLTVGDDYRADTARRAAAATTELRRRAQEVFTTLGLEHTGGRWLRHRAVSILWVIASLIAAVAALTWAALALPLAPDELTWVTLLAAAGFPLAHVPWYARRRPLNSLGRDALGQAEAFQTYLRTVEAEQLSWAAGQPGIDHRHPALSLLPYAMAIGLGDRWYRRFGALMLTQAAAGPAHSQPPASDEVRPLAPPQPPWWAQHDHYLGVRALADRGTSAPSSAAGRSGSPRQGVGRGGGAGTGGGGGGGRSW